MRIRLEGGPGFGMQLNEMTFSCHVCRVAQFISFVSSNITCKTPAMLVIKMKIIVGTCQKFF